MNFQHGNDAARCRQLVQEASSRSNPVFPHVHNLPSQQPGTGNFGWQGTMMPPPAPVDRHRPRGTTDSGVHTLSPTQNHGPQMVPVALSVSPNQSFLGTSPSREGKHSRGLLNKVGNKVGKHLGIGKKHTPTIFVPAPVPSTPGNVSPYGAGLPTANATANGLRPPQSASTSSSTSSPSSPTPPPRRQHPGYGSDPSLMEASGSNGVPSAVGGRRTSAPTRPPPPNHGRPPFVPIAHLTGMAPLSVDLTGHSPTAGSGYDYAMGVLAENPNAFDDDLPPYRSISVPAPSRTRPSTSTPSFTPFEGTSFFDSLLWVS